MKNKEATMKHDEKERTKNENDENKRKKTMKHDEHERKKQEQLMKKSEKNNEK